MFIIVRPNVKLRVVDIIGAWSSGRTSAFGAGSVGSTTAAPANREVGWPPGLGCWAMLNPQ